MECTLNPTATRLPATYLRLFRQGRQPPALDLHVRSPLPDEPPLFAMPDQDMLRQELPVVEFSSTDSKLQQLLGVGSLLRALYVHLGAREPEVRELLPAPVLVGIDWDVVAEHDLRCSSALRRAFGQTPDVPSESVDRQARDDKLPAAR
jgi:hypothetical protein